jgi:gliding motility-associated-like protein
MKKCLSFLLLFFFIKLSAQINLVHNYSFEDTLNCPAAGGQIHYASGWLNPSNSLGSTPDYYNSCSNTFFVPSHFGDFQNAVTGIAYAGFYAFQGLFPNNYEYIQTQLLDSLKKDMTYCVSFYLSLSESSGYYTNDIGLYFSDSVVTTSSNIILVTPQLINTTTILSDKESWMKLSWQYIATGGERFITIGNFSNTSVSTALNTGGAPFSYYMIDNVYVGSCDTTSETFFIPNIFTPNNDGTNDEWIINNLPVNTHIQIYNRWGLEVAGSNIPAGQETYKWNGKTIAGKECYEGVYYYLISTINKRYKGVIQLIK